MQLLLLEPYYGGSHRDVADNLVRHSRHRIELRTLPARLWKWRMRGAAIHFAREVSDHARFDGVICTSLMSVADLKALWGRRCPPVLLYVHETQLAYPNPDETRAGGLSGPVGPPGPAGPDGTDLHFPFTDLTNLLVADAVAWNSRSHFDRYCERLPAFLRMLPEHRPNWAPAEIRRRSEVCHPGITLSHSPAPAIDPDDRAPLLLWNHRWEFDKDPDTFFRALSRVQQTGRAFRLALLGENFQAIPTPFLDAREQFAGELVHYGYVADRLEYESWLAAADVVVSTALGENFGISVLEAAAHGCLPLLPDRLSYPEVFPADLHPHILYADEDDLVRRIIDYIDGRRPPATARRQLVDHARGFAWEKRIEAFDAIFDRLGSTGG